MNFSLFMLIFMFINNLKKKLIEQSLKSMIGSPKMPPYENIKTQICQFIPRATYKESELIKTW